MLSAEPHSIVVTPLRRLDETLRVTGARRVVSVVNAHLMPPTPDGVAQRNHLRLPFGDARPDRVTAHAAQLRLVAELIDFARAWPRDAPLVIHCFSGLNRSTAAAYVVLAALNPQVPESVLAQRLRAASATASPARPLVGLADIVLGRRGRLVAAIDMIGPGLPAAECEPFSISASDATS